MLPIEVPKSAHEQACTEEQHDRQRRSVIATSARARPPRCVVDAAGVFQLMRQILPGGANRRRDSKENAGCERDRRGERQNDAIGADVELSRLAVSGNQA